MQKLDAIFHLKPMPSVREKTTNSGAGVVMSDELLPIVIG